MKRIFIATIVMFGFYVSNAQEAIDTAIQNKANAWAKSLSLNDNEKEARVSNAIATHLSFITKWNNEHPASTVPAGINPTTGNKLSEMDRQVIANSAMPASIHQNLMSGLKKELTEEQVELILDKYTIGKVAFTMKGYHAIVPDLTAKEDSVILNYMKQAREQAVDFKSIKQVSAIFEIYKTKSEQYLNANGRNWRQLYKDFTDKIKAEKEKQNKSN
jgi:hypothetical protein